MVCYHTVSRENTACSDNVNPTHHQLPNRTHGTSTLRTYLRSMYIGSCRYVCRDVEWKEHSKDQVSHNSKSRKRRSKSQEGKAAMLNQTNLNNDETPTMVDESGESSMNSASRAPVCDDDTRTNRHDKVNKKLHYLVIAMGVLGIAGAITAGVVVARNNNGEDGPRYKANPSFNVYQDCFGRDRCTGNEFGKKVRMTADGTRVFVASDEPLQNLVQVFDFNQTTGDWYRHSTIPKSGEREELLGFEVDRSGRRLALITDIDFDRRVVRIYDEACCSYWQPNANITFDVFQQVVSEWEKSNLTDFTYGFGVIDMSPDGKTVAVAHPLASFHGPGDSDNVGCVVVFREVERRRNRSAQEVPRPNASEPMFPTPAPVPPDFLDPPQVEVGSADRSWVPVGRLLRGEWEGERLGERLQLINDTHIAVTRRYNPCSPPELVVRNYMGFVQEIYIELENPRLETEEQKNEIMTTSPDGKFLVVAEANHDPSAYEETPYQGMISIRMYDEDDDRFVSLAYIYGERSFLHLGTSVAMAEDYTLIVGTGNSEPGLNPPVIPCAFIGIKTTGVTMYPMDLNATSTVTIGPR